MNGGEDRELPPAGPRREPASMRALVLIGGGALLLAMAADFIAVIGRHTGLPLLGSIEVVRAAVLIAASAAIVLATLARTHAVVHLVIDRAAPATRAWLIRANRLFSAIFFVALALGSAWIAVDMWGGHEEAELTAIPFAPLRIVSIVSCAVAAGVFLVQALEREPK